MMKTDRSISVVLAGYNEEENIDYAMHETYETLSNGFNEYEMILVDDASRDGTLRKMKAFASTHDNVVVLQNRVNLNFGAAVLRGLYAAQNDYITFNACDLPLSNRDMAKIIKWIEEDTDVMVLERTDYKTTRWRGVTSDINRLLLKVLFPSLTRGTPVLNFVQIYKKSALTQITPLARSPIFVWPEMVFRAKLKGLTVRNVKAKCNIAKVRKGAFGHPHDIFWGIYDMLRFRIRLWLCNY